MTGWLVDTNVISELRKPRPEKRVVSFVSQQPLDVLFISIVTFAEIRFGIERLDDAAKRARISAWLENEMRPLFEDRVLPLSENILLKWRLIIEEGRKNGYTFSHPDVLIAATAAHHGLTVVSRNTREFVAASVSTFDPWTGEQSS
ncbi:MAG TPA: type II toxin-antitoxin system VapC family toxin [Rhizobiales bacterium]|nr:type II toxin-antitoxin system VapC family toxin [Hyphomicrobiales bacterium]